MVLQKDCSISLYGDRVVFGDMVLPFSEITSATCLGRNKLNIYHGKQVYQLKGGKRFNAMKYMNLYFRYRNITKDNPEDRFLGI